MLPYTIFRNNFQCNYLICDIDSILQVENFGLAFYNKVQANGLEKEGFVACEWTNLILI